MNEERDSKSGLERIERNRDAGDLLLGPQAANRPEERNWEGHKEGKEADNEDGGQVRKGGRKGPKDT